MAALWSRWCAMTCGEVAEGEMGREMGAQRVVPGFPDPSTNQIYSSCQPKHVKASVSMTGTHYLFWSGLNVCVWVFTWWEQRRDAIWRETCLTADFLLLISLPHAQPQIILYMNRGQCCDSDSLWSVFVCRVFLEARAPLVETAPQEQG